MKKAGIVVLLLLSLLSIPSVTEGAHPNWEQTAVKNAKMRYPHTQVLYVQNYWHNLKKDPAVRQYRITLTDGKKPFAVIVTIRYQKENGKILSAAVLEER
ncbi:YqzG/YhdC family protein [Metabacillus sp. GX 13764]|uniref:DUF3889 domain-containing protein n=1 Tax=Metabacillus kandeliae TaxID=2900151 RepID=UPI001E420D97|nr:YqzG/YhdC family protein [Metabacillus kandeliae]